MDLECILLCDVAAHLLASTSRVPLLNPCSFVPSLFVVLFAWLTVCLFFMSYRSHTLSGLAHKFVRCPQPRPSSILD